LIQSFAEILKVQERLKPDQPDQSRMLTLRENHLHFQDPSVCRYLCGLSPLLRVRREMSHRIASSILPGMFRPVKIFCVEQASVIPRSLHLVLLSAVPSAQFGMPRSPGARLSIGWRHQS
jgi:hypothetical protein